MRFLTSLAFSSALLVTAPAALADMPDVQFNGGGVPAKGDVIILADDGALSGLGADLDATLNGQLSSALKRHEFSGKFGKSVTFKALAPFDTITVIGTGTEPLSKRKLQDLGGHAAIGADCIALDDGVTAEWAAEHVQKDGCVQGNLASSHMVTGGQALIDETRAIVRAFSKGPHIFNLGHGITPDADPENVQLMIDTVRGN